MKTFIIVLIVLVLLYLAWLSGRRRGAGAPDKKKETAPVQQPVKVSVPKAATVTVSMGEDFVNVEVTDWTDEEMDEATQYYHEETSEVLGDFISEDLIGKCLRGELDAERSARITDRLRASGMDVEFLRKEYVGTATVEEASRPALTKPDAGGEFPTREEISARVDEALAGHTEGDGTAPKEDLGDFQPSAVLPRSMRRA